MSTRTTRSAAKTLAAGPGIDQGGVGARKGGGQVAGAGAAPPPKAGVPLEKRKANLKAAKSPAFANKNPYSAKTSSKVSKHHSSAVKIKVEPLAPPSPALQVKEEDELDEDELEDGGEELGEDMAGVKEEEIDELEDEDAEPEEELDELDDDEPVMDQALAEEDDDAGEEEPPAAPKPSAKKEKVPKSQDPSPFTILSQEESAAAGASVGNVDPTLRIWGIEADGKRLPQKALLARGWGSKTRWHCEQCQGEKKKNLPSLVRHLTKHHKLDAGILQLRPIRTDHRKIVRQELIDGSSED
ncbi:hypothetical protein RQP46_010874 [Phenoliferia psychrophenolica]